MKQKPKVVSKLKLQQQTEMQVPWKIDNSSESNVSTKFYHCKPKNWKFDFCFGNFCLHSVRMIVSGQGLWQLVRHSSSDDDPGGSSDDGGDGEECSDVWVREVCEEVKSAVVGPGEACRVSTGRCKEHQAHKRCCQTLQQTFNFVKVALSKRKDQFGNIGFLQKF